MFGDPISHTTFQGYRNVLKKKYSILSKLNSWKSWNLDKTFGRCQDFYFRENGISYVFNICWKMLIWSLHITGGHMGGRRGFPSLEPRIYTPLQPFFTLLSKMTSSYPKGQKEGFCEALKLISFRMSQLPIQHFGQWHEKSDRHLSDGPMYVIGKSHKYR